MDRFAESPMINTILNWQRFVTEVIRSLLFKFVSPGVNLWEPRLIGYI